MPKLSQRDAANRLNMSEAVLCRLLKDRSSIENAVIQNENLSTKRKSGGKDDDMELVLKEWFSEVRAKDARVTGPLLHQKVEDLAQKIGKADYVAKEGWFHRWKKRENMCFVKSHGEIGDTDAGAAHAWLESEAEATKISKEQLAVLCYVGMTGEEKKLLAIGKSKNPRCFKGVNNLLVEYKANAAWITRTFSQHDFLIVTDS